MDGSTGGVSGQMYAGTFSGSSIPAPSIAAKLPRSSSSGAKAFFPGLDEITEERESGG
jgi:hypothetical protein